MENTNKISVSEEDEEDLEALRLAALQSLKRKTAPTNDNGVPHAFHVNELAPVAEHPVWYSNRGGRHFPNKRGRFYGLRGAKNGQFQFHPSQRVRNSNLISITPIDSDENNDAESSKETVSSKLTLPQDRFYSTEQKEDQSTDFSSKFKRYDNSDESDEDSEDDKVSGISDDENIEKLTRSDSLEALLQELDDEIEGKIKPKEDKPVKTKTKVKRKKISDVTTSASELKPAESEIVTEEEALEPKSGDVENDIKETVGENKSTDDPTPKKLRHSPPPRPFYDRRTNRHFVPNSFGRRGYHNQPRYARPAHFPNLPQSVPPRLPHLNMNMPVNMGYNLPAPFFDRPLSPLSINTETLQAQTRAPLSPRSAAFVLQNRAIIEKRKRSPRRSYSRSPSPRLRSLSPRSPRRSLTPRRKSRSPPNRRSLSPRRRSLSPRRNPVRKPPSPAVTSPKSSRPTIKERLGLKTNPKQEEKEPSPKKEIPEEPKSKVEEKPLDPILEARKRKFETKEITVKEGVIRLRLKDDKETGTNEGGDSTIERERYFDQETFDERQGDEEEINEAALLDDDDIELNAKVDIFSDEESGSENEGRFKTKDQSSTTKPPVLSFSKLLNGCNHQILENKPLISSQGSRRYRRDRTTRKVSKVSSVRTRSPEKKDVVASTSTEKNEQVKESKTSEPVKKTRTKKETVSYSKSRMLMKSERHPESPKRFERKIEIKIKNPSKYEKGLGENLQEKSARLKFARDAKERHVEKITRKVEVENKDKVIDDEKEEGAISDDMETEVVVDNDSEEEENISSEGDLRAQLSKKRAEKLHKILPAKSVPSRLLQNALEGVVFKKVKKHKSKSRELSSSDVKLPIHLRLGIAGHPDIFEEKPKRKSRKRKNREMQEQEKIETKQRHTSYSKMATSDFQFSESEKTIDLKPHLLLLYW